MPNSQLSCAYECFRHGKIAALYQGCELEKTRLFCRTRKNYIIELKLAKIG